MARFKYLGEPARPGLVAAYGPTTELRLPCKDGTTHVLTPVAPATRFEPDADMGYDITDPRSLRALRVDHRFQEIV